MKNDENVLSPELFVGLLKVLKARFLKHPGRHEGIEWGLVQARLEGLEKRGPLGIRKLLALYEMERTGGEPDVTGFLPETNEFIFCDCSAETPKARRSVCYDNDALESRKEHKPWNNALEMASEMGIEILDEAQYLALQQLGNFDTKSSSWIKTPDTIRKQGGALFGSRRFGHVFLYANGAQSYFSERGFRGRLRI